MLGEAPVFVVVCAAFGLLLALLVAVFALPDIWRGTSRTTPEIPPPGWHYSKTLWRRMTYGIIVIIPTLGLACVAVLLSRVSTAVADAVLLAVFPLLALSLSEALFARPRILIPPSWRPDRADSVSSD